LNFGLLLKPAVVAGAGGAPRPVGANCVRPGSLAGGIPLRLRGAAPANGLCPLCMIKRPCGDGERRKAATSARSAPFPMPQHVQSLSQGKTGKRGSPPFETPKSRGPTGVVCSRWARRCHLRAVSGDVVRQRSVSTREAARFAAALLCKREVRYPPSPPSRRMPRVPCAHARVIIHNGQSPFAAPAAQAKR
jgi:hypothetical protein